MSGAERAMWEYQSEVDADDARLNELGGDGWEFVAANGGRFVFKRQCLTFRERVTLEQKRRYYAPRGLSAQLAEGAGG